MRLLYIYPLRKNFGLVGIVIFLSHYIVLKPDDRLADYVAWNIGNHSMQLHHTATSEMDESLDLKMIRVKMFHH